MGYRHPDDRDRCCHAHDSFIPVNNGTITRISIPCFSRDDERPPWHDRPRHDHEGWPDPDNPDDSCQGLPPVYDQIIVMNEIDLVAEGYDTIDVSLLDPPEGLTVTGEISQNMVNLTVVAMCEAAEKKGLYVPFAVYAIGTVTGTGGAEDLQMRDLVTKGTIHVCASPINDDTYWVTPSVYDRIVGNIEDMEKYVTFLCDHTMDFIGADYEFLNDVVEPKILDDVPFTPVPCGPDFDSPYDFTYGFVPLGPAYIEFTGLYLLDNVQYNISTICRFDGFDGAFDVTIPIRQEEYDYPGDPMLRVTYDGNGNFTVRGLIHFDDIPDPDPPHNWTLTPIQDFVATYHGDAFRLNYPADEWININDNWVDGYGHLRGDETVNVMYLFDKDLQYNPLRKRVVGRATFVVLGNTPVGAGSIVDFKIVDKYNLPTVCKYTDVKFHRASQFEDPTQRPTIDNIINVTLYHDELSIKPCVALSEGDSVEIYVDYPVLGRHID